MQLLPRMNVMLYFICMGPVDLPGAHRKRQNTTDALPIELPGLDESCTF